MWLDPKADGCMYDTIDCYHNCEGCYYGRMVCSGCGNLIDWKEDRCSDCGINRKEAEICVS